MNQTYEIKVNLNFIFDRDNIDLYEKHGKVKDNKDSFRRIRQNAPDVYHGVVATIEKKPRVGAPYTLSVLCETGKVSVDSPELEWPDGERLSKKERIDVARRILIGITMKNFRTNVQCFYGQGTERKPIGPKEASAYLSALEKGKSFKFEHEKRELRVPSPSGPPQEPTGLANTPVSGK